MKITWIKSLTLIITCIVSLMASAEVKSSKRIIALAPHIVENLYQIGAGDRIIGTTDHADFPKAALDIPRVGNYARLSIEQILAMNPDLIIAWKSGNPSDDLARLAEFDIPIVYSNPKSLEDVAQELRDFGRWTGLQNQAETSAVSFLTQLNALRNKYADKQLISAFYELWSRPLTTVAKNAWLQQQLDVCQVDNPFKDSATDYPQINIEQVVLAAPKIIIKPTSHGSQSPDKIDWHQWPKMPAVEAKAFLHPDADMLYRMTSRSLQELENLCEQVDRVRLQGQ